MEALDQFLEAVGRLDLASAVTRRGPPLVGVPVVGTGRGGKERQRGLILNALIERLWSAAAAQPEVDYALVTFRAADYETAQWVRRHTGKESCWEPLGRDLRQAAARLGRKALTGDLVLFLGAGVSMGAGLPSWSGLLGDLAERAGYSADHLRKLEKLDPLDAARLIERRLDAKGHVIGWVIAARLKSGRHSISHALLATLPVREIATTNYDNLSSRRARPSSAPPRCCPIRPDPSCTRWVLKLHGTVEHPAEIVLTRDDYLAYGARRAALAGLVQGPADHQTHALPRVLAHRRQLSPHRPRCPEGRPPRRKRAIANRNGDPARRRPSSRTLGV
jgi:hypothetical protein